MIAFEPQNSRQSTEPLNDLFILLGYLVTDDIPKIKEVPCNYQGSIQMRNHSLIEKA
jgi:hypothetical protein